MSSKNIKKYKIGLDIGTGSVGYAVTDENNKILYYNKKPMWGVHLFDTAETAANRRIARSTRRGYTRRKNRIKFLQELIGEEVNKVDNKFFNRLIISHELCKSENQYNLFDGYQEYRNKYKTIYHLRNAMMANENEQFDIRLIYLVLHHMLKYRGNFLRVGSFKISTSESNNTISKIISLFAELDKKIDEKDAQLLVSTDTSKKDKKNHFKSDKGLQELVAMVIGSSTTVDSFFDIEKQKDITNGVALSNEKKIEDLLENFPELEEKLNIIQEIYFLITLEDILKGESTISKAKITQYNKYNNDLHTIKDIIRKNDPKKFKELFKGDDCLYAKYPEDDEKGKKGKTFIKEIKKSLSKNIDEQSKILSELEDKTFLRKQNNTDNSAIPYQLNYNEMEIILENQSKYYPGLKENKDKILSIMKFRIPYYVGPLANGFKDTNGNSYSENSWIVRNNDEKIRPWNFDENVDKVQSSIEFINRLTNDCTYLLGEEVIPKESLLYSKYMVLSELNNLKIDGTRITQDAKKSIYNDLIIKGESLTKKNIKKYWKEQYGEDVEITGFQAEDGFATKLTSYLDFVKIIGSEKLVNENEKDIEKIINWLTIVPKTDVSIIESLMHDQLKNENFTKEHIKKIMKLQFQGWGRLSNKFLNGIPTKYDNANDHRTVIEVMENEVVNLMEIIKGNDSTFSKTIENINKIYLEDEKTDNLQSIIEQIPGSPELRRSITKTIHIIDEINSIMKCAPTNISIEDAKNIGAKQRTKSRNKTLEELKTKFKEEFKQTEEWKYKKDIHNDSELRNEKLFLYYLQNGKCLYTGKDLNIDNLDQYEVDHIIPQSMVKDDSLDNKALVTKSANQDKKANTVLETFGHSQVARWNKLYKSNCISQKKYNSLMIPRFTDHKIEGFINRQLVETRQIIKHVINLLETWYDNEDLVITPVRANLVKEVEKAGNIIKIRDLNDKHHAQDAYASILAAQVLNDYFDKSNNNSKFKLKMLEDMRSKPKENYIKHLIRKDIIEKYGNVIDFINHSLDYRVTYALGKKKTGQLWKQSIVQPSLAGIALKTPDRLGIKKTNNGYITENISKDEIKNNNQNYLFIIDKNKLKKEDNLSQIKKEIYTIGIKKSNKDTYITEDISKDKIKQAKQEYSYIIDHNMLIKTPEKNLGGYTQIQVYAVGIKKTEKGYIFEDITKYERDKVENDYFYILYKNQLMEINHNKFLITSSGERSMAKQSKLNYQTLSKLSELLNKIKNGTFNITDDKKTIALITNKLIKVQNGYFNSKQIEKIKVSMESITDIETVNKYINNLLKACFAGGGRVDEWSSAGRHQGKLCIDNVYIITQSITGLHEKKEKLIDILKRIEDKKNEL